MDITRREASVLQCLTARTLGAVDQIGAECLQLRSSQLYVEMFRSLLVCGNERQIDVGLYGRGELAFGLLSGLFEALQGHAVLAKVYSLVLFELVCQVINHSLIEVFAAQEGISIGGSDFKDTVAQFQNRNVEGSTAQVEDRDFFIFLLVQSIRQRCRGRFVDNAQNIQAGDATCVFGSLPLAVVEIGRY